MTTRVDPNSLAIDSNALNGLKRSAQQDTPEAIRAAAKQFEAVLMNMMLKSMRETVSQDGMTDNEQSRMFTGMLDQQLSTHLSEKGLGLADALVRQLSKLQSPGSPDGKSALPDASQGTAIPAKDKVSATYQQWQALGQTVSNDVAQASTGNDWSGLLNAAGRQAAQLTNATGSLVNQVREVSGKTAQFIQQMLPHADAASTASGIPAKFMIGQAALESGWGKHEIKAADGSSSHNLFGIKADARWQGKVVNSVTSEYVNGVKQTRVEKFRAYDSYSAAFQDYASLISQNPRYQQAMQNTHDAGAYASALQRAGYATDPDYGKKLTQVIQHMQG